MKDELSNMLQNIIDILEHIEKLLKSPKTVIGGKELNDYLQKSDSSCADKCGTGQDIKSEYQ